MKIRPSVFLFVAIVAVLIALLLWYEKKRPTETASVSSIETNAAQPTIPTPSQSTSVPMQTNALAPQTATNAIIPSSQDKWAQIQPILATQNDVPIVFYGRVEDQFGNPVTGAQIAASVRIYNGFQSTVDHFSTTSDANGFFQINHGKGESLTVVPEKSGYVLATTGTVFKYSHLESHPFVPDQNNPTVIKMYKLQGAEHLISFNIKTHIPIDGTPIRFDLQTGQLVQNDGDLILSLHSSPKPSLQDGYDWQASIQLVEGGIIQDSSGLGLQKMFQAPDAGYEPKFDLNFQKGTQQWTSRVNEGFYFTSRSNKFYGKLALSIITDRVKDNVVPLTLNGYLNPAGSRNLELEQ